LVVNTTVLFPLVGIHELQKEEHRRLEYRQHPFRFYWWNSQYASDDP